MKVRCCIVFAFICCLHANAQKMRDKQPLMVDNGLIDFQAGMAIPVMDFADKSFKLASGYANPGYALKLGIRYDITTFLGVGLHYQYFQNGFDQSNFLSDMRSANKAVTFNSFTSDPWSLQGVMFGVYFPLKSYRSSVDIGIAGGVLTGVYPTNTLNYNNPVQTNIVFNVKQYETNAANFGMQAGVKMRYQVYKNVMLTASADFTYTEIEYTDIQSEETNYKIPIYLEPYTQYYHIIQLAAGIGLQLK
jgi:hypothetical protein